MIMIQEHGGDAAYDTCGPQVVGMIIRIMMVII
jgi:hypothetical protein